MTGLAVYIHWPFCLSKCPYCDFNSRVATPENEADFLKAYQREISFYGEKLPARRVSSIYFGGGTPSLMKPRTLEALIESVAAMWPLDPDVEITLEANPTTAEREKFLAFRRAGVQRLSLGLQSFRDDVLKFLGRTHDAAQGLGALDLALQVFPRVSFDLIYAYAGQSAADWAQDLARATSYGVRHLSLYQLTLEPHTPFARRAQKGESLIQDPDHAATLYALSQEVLGAAGLPAYEVSNHAAVGADGGQESRHNLAYWHYDPYIGIGPSAAGRVDAEELCAPTNALRLATTNLSDPKAWREQVLVRGHGIAEKESLGRDEARKEALLMGLRLVAGIELAHWEKIFGTPLAQDVSEKKWKKLESEGLVETTATHWKTTPQGLATLNAVLAYLCD